MGGRVRPPDVAPRARVLDHDVFDSVAPHVVVATKIRARPEQPPEGSVVESGKCVAEG